MKTNLKLKIVKRNGIVETNSSSSHSVVIQTTGTLCSPGDNYWDLDIRDNVLYIPNRTDGFGWEEFKSNSCLTKLQYVCGLMCEDVFSAYGHKKIHKLTQALKSILGVDDVKYEWIEENKEKFDFSKHDIDPADCYIDCIEVDHNSTELIYEIFENEYTLKNFILNPGSWLYGGNDNSTPSRDFRSETYIIENDDNIPECYFSIDVSNTGRIDIPFNVSHDFKSGLFYYSDDNIIKNLAWKKKDNLIVLNTREDSSNKYFSKEDLIAMTKETLYVNNICPVIIIDNSSYLLFGPETDVIAKRIEKTMNIKGREEIISDIITNPSSEFVNGIDYKLVKFELIFPNLK